MISMGQSVNVKHLGKYLRKSKDKYIARLRKDFPELPDETVMKLANDKVNEELRAGIQTMQYQINTLMTTNGQSPFVTLFMHVEEGYEYEKEVAMIIEEILKQRIEGIKNEAGVYITPAFPKLIYVLDECNCLKGGKYDYLTKLAVKCSSKRMYPDYISAKKMKEIYEGNVFSCMGCVEGKEIVTYRFNGKLYVEAFERMWNRLTDSFEVKHQLPTDDRYLYLDVLNVEIWDSKIHNFTKVLRVIRNISTKWAKVTLSNNRSITVTQDHPFETENRGVVYAKDLLSDDIIISQKIDVDVNSSDYIYKNNQTELCTIKDLQLYEIDNFEYSYDVTTDSEHFEVSGIYSHNCRSFLSPWKDENGNYKWEGRFNQGVVSINLPQIALIASKETTEDAKHKTFWDLLDERLELCFEALMCRHKALKDVRSDVAPILWQHGAFARLGKGEKVEKLLKNGYSTISLGYIGIYETTKLMTGVSHTNPVGTKFALEVMNYMKSKCDEWKKETGLGFGLYGTPAESLCYRFARIDKEKFGEVKDVTDKGYYTNSYHKMMWHN